MLFRNQNQHNSSIFGDALERMASNLDSSESTNQDPPKVALDPDSFVGNKNTVIPSTSTDSIKAKTSSKVLGSSRSALMFDRDIYDNLVEDSRDKTDRLRSEEAVVKKEAQDSFESTDKPSEEEQEILIQKSSSSVSPMSDQEDNSGMIPSYENSIFDKESFERLNVREPELKKNVSKEAEADSGPSRQLTSNDLVDNLFSKLNPDKSGRSTFTERTLNSLYELINNNKE
jgi:vacuolar-type H+-ATPase subunit H